MDMESLEIFNGLKMNKDVQMVKTFEEADYIVFTMDTRNFWNLPHRGRIRVKEDVMNQIKNHKDYHKEIIVDYNDYTDLRNVEDSIVNKVFLYFKRSIVNRRRMIFEKYNRDVKFISYGIRSDFIEYDKSIGTLPYNYDICCMFKLKPNPKILRELIANVVDEYPGKKYIGFVDNGTFHSRYSKVNTEYYNIMKQSKMIITANPHHQEGDFRLWEALLTGNLVFCDRMLTVDILKNKLVHKKHLVFYDDLDELRNLIVHFVRNENERKKIGQNGREYALKYHKFTDRADEIVEAIKSKK